MKTETQIAKSLLEEMKKAKVKEKLIWKSKLFTLKLLCQRFLKFVKDLKVVEGTTFDKKEKRIFEQITAKKIVDLKQAIKLYNEAGI